MVNFKTVAVVVIAVLLGACATSRVAPIYNVADAPVAGTTGQTLSMADVERAIRRAGAGLGWQMKTVKPGLIEATLILRTHSATVDIPFNSKSYGIQYKTSSNLNAEGGNIHQNYNGWVQNLDKAIRLQMLAN